MGSCCCTCSEDQEEEQRPLTGTFSTSTMYDRDKALKFEHVQADIHGAPTNKKWYHGGITDEEARIRLRSVTGGEDTENVDNWSEYTGVYLVYDNHGRQDEYTLLVYYRGDLCKWMISRRKSDGQYILGKDGPNVSGHKSVRNLIHYHRGATGKAIKLQHGGTVTLKKSYPYQPNV